MELCQQKSFPNFPIFLGRVYTRGGRMEDCKPLKPFDAGDSRLDFARAERRPSFLLP